MFRARSAWRNVIARAKRAEIAIFTSETCKDVLWILYFRSENTFHRGKHDFVAFQAEENSSLAKNAENSVLRLKNAKENAFPDA